ncbi:hypothetical protein ORI20_08810 [Mycobacterium sp. CVI_P3]|uniref:Uncharacterized protein n=1 Tax=Mycobacterium pinniadriaticum TaxID=2994102 RepID=A0ABT3SBP4_9MYCO|nr:hypothetical protein [Mycobacterium pinniadriaticum]MCX2930374.1 hypothetical protein [Mycobacterium pinniadriaticum]MCX2936564.1 hypothetical protein [Mycobacterium pinniadriaticum]
MPEPVTLDTAAASALVEQLTRAADEIATIPIPGLDACPGSALGGVDAPRRVTAEVRRLGADIGDWVCSARRSVEELAAAENVSAERLRTR